MGGKPHMTATADILDPMAYIATMPKHVQDKLTEALAGWSIQMDHLKGRCAILHRSGVGMFPEKWVFYISFEGWSNPDLRYLTITLATGRRSIDGTTRCAVIYQQFKTTKAIRDFWDKQTIMHGYVRVGA